MPPVSLFAKYLIFYSLEYYPIYNEINQKEITKLHQNRKVICMTWSSGYPSTLVYRRSRVRSQWGSVVCVCKISKKRKEKRKVAT